jgi:hypothetical protein
MLRKVIRNEEPASSIAAEPAIHIPDLATIFVTSEAEDHPVEHLFDGRNGPGGTRWVAAMPGDQTLTLAFDSPQAIRKILLEVEETMVNRTQELTLAVSSDGGSSYQELLRQEYTFSPPSTTFEREEWRIPGPDTTHIRLWIRPDKGSKPCYATVTSLQLLAQ